MARGTENQARELAAGGFSAWLDGLHRALAGEAASEVPCGECTACCTSSQFVHIGPDETETLARIPRALLFPAPGRPEGHVVLGYDERGRCPMLADNGCSIYAARPRTCRTYDCRVLPATGTDLDAPEQAAIAQQARRWRFSVATAADRDRHAATTRAAAFLREHRDRFPPDMVPSNPTQLAVLAVEVHHLFLGGGDGTAAVPAHDVVEREVARLVRRDRA